MPEVRRWSCDLGFHNFLAVLKDLADICEIDIFSLILSSALLLPFHCLQLLLQENGTKILYKSGIRDPNYRC